MSCFSTYQTPILLFTLTSSFVLAHDGPDPLARWRGEASAVVKNSDGSSVLKARLGPDARILGDYQLIGRSPHDALVLEGGTSALEVAKNYTDAAEFLPTEHMTVAAWVSVDKPQRWGGLAGAVLDNGETEFGWILGYDETTFTFALRGENGNGRLTYLKGKTAYKAGKLYHVVGVYDGKTMQLFVNGKLDGSSKVQAGKIIYPKATPFMIGGYRDSNEFQGHRGRIVEVTIYDHAALPKWVQHDFQHDAVLAKLPAVDLREPLKFVIDPYLQYGTQTTMTVMWQTNRTGTGIVHFGETAECSESFSSPEAATIHEMRLENLRPETQYFYRVETQLDSGSEAVFSDAFTFQTAVIETTPFAFAVISDTQGNPSVSGKLAEFAWGQRPSFLLHPGDLVSTGGNDSHWTQHYFPSMHPLIRHVPFFPVLGNHEQNHRNYFNYVSLPNPEYFYRFSFGNSEFFMIDSNRNVGPESEQYQWLDKSLSQSEATWKFVCHHHPPYSSDENDYGNLWKTNKGTQGDLRVRKLAPLYEKHNVDIVWNGHIHSYERTWPIRANKAVDRDGPIYMITGGGGGSLETPGPIRPFFMNTVRRGHHYAMVRINGTTLEVHAYDIENRLFDSLVIQK